MIKRTSTRSEDVVGEFPPRFGHSPYRIEGGQATVTDAPGWGVEISPEWLARSDYRMTEAE